MVKRQRYGATVPRLRVEDKATGTVGPLVSDCAEREERRADERGPLNWPCVSSHECTTCPAYASTGDYARAPSELLRVLAITPRVARAGYPPGLCATTPRVTLSDVPGNFPDDLSGLFAAFRDIATCRTRRVPRLSPE